MIVNISFLFLVVFTAMFANSSSWQEALNDKGRAGGVSGASKEGVTRKEGRKPNLPRHFL